MKNNIDIDRLHSVLLGKVKHRGCGQTFAMLVTLAQSAQANAAIKPARFVLVSDYHRSYLVNEFMRICILLGIRATWYNPSSAITIHDGTKISIITLATANGCESRLRGIRFDGIFIDHATRDAVSRRDMTFLDSLVIKRENYGNAK
jgi:hypothetical protein